MSIAVLAHGVLAGAEGFYFSLTGLVSGFIFFLVLSLLGPMGAGDVKLMGTIGALIGPYGAVMAGILSLMVGGLYALGVMWLQRALSNPPPKLRLHAQGPISPPGTGTALRLRYGVAIAAGTALFLMGVHPFGG
jgi:prepilin peptidase CpaA